MSQPTNVRTNGILGYPVAVATVLARNEERAACLEYVIIYPGGMEIAFGFWSAPGRADPFPSPDAPSSMISIGLTASRDALSEHTVIRDSAEPAHSGRLSLRCTDSRGSPTRARAICWVMPLPLDDLKLHCDWVHIGFEPFEFTLAGREIRQALERAVPLW